MHSFFSLFLVVAGLRFGMFLRTGTKMIIVRHGPQRSKTEQPVGGALIKAAIQSGHEEPVAQPHPSFPKSGFG